MPTVRDFIGRFSAWNGGVRRDFPGGGAELLWRDPEIQRLFTFPEVNSRFLASISRWEGWLEAGGYANYDLRQLMTWEGVENFRHWIIKVLGRSVHDAKESVSAIVQHAWIPLVRHGVLPPFDSYGNRRGRANARLNDTVLGLGAEVERLLSALREVRSMKRRLMHFEQKVGRQHKRIDQLERDMIVLKVELKGAVILKSPQ